MSTIMFFAHTCFILFKHNVKLIEEMFSYSMKNLNNFQNALSSKIVSEYDQISNFVHI